MTTDRSLLGKTVGKGEKRRPILRLLSDDAIELIERLLRELSFYKPAPDDNALISIMCNPVIISWGYEYLQRKGTKEDKESFARGLQLFRDEILKEALRGIEHRDAFEKQEKAEAVENSGGDRVCSLELFTANACIFFSLYDDYRSSMMMIHMS